MTKGDASLVDLGAAASRIEAEREEEVGVAQDAQLRAGAPPAVFVGPWCRKGVLPVLARVGIVGRMLRRMDQPLRYGARPVHLNV